MSMQRKLTLVLVGIALASILLVGAGVLAFTQVGAREDATAAVEEQLIALQTIATRSDENALRTVEPAVRRLGAAFDNGQLAVVLVDDGGEIRPLPTRPGTDLVTVAGSQSLIVSADQLEALRSGDTVVIDQSRNVVGLVRLDIPTRAEAVRGGIPALWARQSVGSVSSQAIRWFVLSAAIVLIASALAATWLARRFTEPLRAIQRATAAIASGKLDTRISDVGSDELGQLAGSVNAMTADLERSRAAEQQFLMSITHDLRTPLTSISGYAEALRDGAIDEPGKAGAIIGKNADRLDRLVGDLLMLAKLESRAFSFHVTSFDLITIAGEQVENARQRAEGFGVAITLVGAPGLDTTVLGDPDRTRQVIDNLIDNALKFASGAISLRVESKDSTVDLAVADDGPGIPPDDLPFVFERLYVTQLRPVRAENSSGLGLAIVRELVEGMGGSVTADRIDSGGTVIAFSLPKQHPAVLPPAPAHRSP